MPKVIRVVGLSGCCDCAEQDGCECGSTLEVLFQCRQRLTFPFPGGWSEWATVGVTEGCDSGDPCCKAISNPDLPIVNEDAQFQLVVSGYTPVTLYQRDVNIWRRAAGTSDPFTLYATLTVGTTTDGSGAYVYSDDVPNESGYESYAELVP